MKTFTFFFLLIFLAPATYAQNYMISFAGTGAATTVDSVHVQNLTQCTAKSLMKNDVLNLSATTVINTFSDEGTICLNIFPNPTSGTCTANFNSPANGNATIEIYDAIGKRIAQRQQFLSNGQYSFSIEGIYQGVFLLKIQSETYSCTAKLISNRGIPNNVALSEIKETLYIPASCKLNDGKNVVTMLYHTDDQLKFTGYSGIYKTVYMLVPTQGQIVTFNFIPCTDADSNNYAVVQIGTQVWMEENLKTTKYSNGDSIPYVPDFQQWWNLITDAYCHYNTDINNVKVYGEIYNGFVLFNPEICPIGWHVPDTIELSTLINYLGGDTLAGGKLKENCSIHWQSPNSATNESGFTALPGGWCYDTGNFGDIGSWGNWWSSTHIGIIASYLTIDYSSNYAQILRTNENFGLSIRCLKD